MNMGRLDTISSCWTIDLAKDQSNRNLKLASAESAPAKGAGKPKPAPAKQAPPPVVNPTARATRVKARHWGLLISFLLCVVLPSSFAGWYLSERAVDRYGSSVGFTVRQEEAQTAFDLLGGLSNISSSSSSDSDILFEFIQSQDLVAQIDAELDLRTLYSVHYDQDPVFSLKPNASMEDLLDHWRKEVSVAYAPGTGLIEIQAKAYDAETAKLIAETIFEKSSAMINALSDIAREDATRYAREDLEDAVEQLKSAREELTSFRARTQIIDPAADIQIQMGVLTTMQQQLGEELITLDLLRESARPDDPRRLQSEQRVAAIRARIREEREKFGAADDTRDGSDYATLVAEFERLTVDLEFAQEKYSSGLANFDLARAEAQRQSRYLAAYIRPTLAETAEFPQRILLFTLVILFSSITWGILVLITYALRDRR